MARRTSGGSWEPRSDAPSGSGGPRQAGGASPGPARPDRPGGTDGPGGPGGPIGPGERSGPVGARRRKVRSTRAGGAQRTRPLEARPGALAGWTDEELFEEVRRGSEVHFNALYERYFRRIYHFIHMRLRNHADAEELTQETFAVVFRSAEAFSGRSSPLGWIYGIAKNTVNNHLRRLRVQGERLEEAGPEALTADSPEWRGTPEDHLALSRILRAIEQRLARLTPWQSEVFLLRHVDNASIREICQRTARSSDAVRSGLYRAKRELLDATGQPQGPETGPASARE